MLGLVPNLVSCLWQRRHLHCLGAVADSSVIFPTEVLLMEVGVCSVSFFLKSTNQLISLEAKVNFQASVRQEASLVSVDVVVVGDQAHSRCVVCKFNDGTGAVGVQGVQERPERTALQGSGGDAAHPYHLLTTTTFLI